MRKSLGCCVAMFAGLLLPGGSAGRAEGAPDSTMSIAADPDGLRGATTAPAAGPSPDGWETEEAISRVETLPQVDVTATRLSLDPFDLPYAFYRHDREAIETAVGRTALDRIDYGPGVIIQHTGPGQTSPYIRGLTGKQSLLLFDGVRLSHAAMRGGPNQYFALVPDMSIESIDAILGSSGVVNGSDGLTGAMDIRMAAPGRWVGRPASPWGSTRIDSANGAQVASGLDGESGDWRYSVESSYHDFHDRVGGKDASDNVFGDDGDSGDEIPNTAFSQWAAACRTAFDGFRDRSVEVAIGHTRQNDAPRPDGYYENSGVSSRVSRYYDPETFTYLHLRDTWAPDGLFFRRLVTTLWWHQQDEQQVREDLASGGTVYRRREYDDRIGSFGIEPQATSPIGDHELTYGVLALFERTGNDYREYRNLGGTDPAGATPYRPEDWSRYTTITDGAEYDTYAVYLQDLWRLTGEWSLLGGVRYTRVDWEFDVADGDADDLTGSLRASWQFREDMLAFLGVSKAFRAPNLIDLDGATDRASSGTIDFGNPDLDPETSYTVEAGWRYHRERDRLGATAFYTRIEDVIQTVYPEGAGAGESDNGEGAYLRGFELEWDYGLPVVEWVGGDRFAVFGSVSLTDSEAKVPQSDGSTDRQPISRANRLFGLAGLRCEINRNWWVMGQVRFHDAYDDVTPEDADDVRLTVPGSADGSMPGFGVVDVAAGWVSDAGDRRVTLTLENLGDKTYRPLGSGEDAPGFNIVLAVEVRF